VRGTVRDSASGGPLEGVEVVVVDSGVLASTDAGGTYVVMVSVGFRTLRFRKIGYRSEVRRIGLFAADTVDVSPVLAPAPQELPDVEVRTAPPDLWPPGLEERRREGFGHFLDEDLLRRSEHRPLSQLIRAYVPRIRLRRVGSKTVIMGQSAGPVCPMAIWVDGLRVYAPSSQLTSPFGTSRMTELDAYDLDQHGVFEIQAVEVYSVSQTPARYQTTGSGCGTVLLWTRRR